MFLGLLRVGLGPRRAGLRGVRASEAEGRWRPAGATGGTRLGRWAVCGGREASGHAQGGGRELKGDAGRIMLRVKRGRDWWEGAKRGSWCSLCRGGGCACKGGGWALAPAESGLA